MKKIYFITFINLNEKKQVSETFTWGWYPTFEEAEKVAANATEAELEFYYNYAVIEESKPGWCYQGLKEMGWFKYTRDEDEESIKTKITVESIDKPKYFKNIVAFCMG